MKKIYFILLCCSCFCISYSQEKKEGTVLRVEPNGVVVYKAIDVEQTLGIKHKDISDTKEEKIPSKTIDDFSLEELEEILYYINLKMETITNIEDNADDIKNYADQKRLIEEKILKIKPTRHDD